MRRTLLLVLVLVFLGSVDTGFPASADAPPVTARVARGLSTENYGSPEVVFRFPEFGELKGYTATECKVTVVIRSTVGGSKNQRNLVSNWCGLGLGVKAKGPTWKWRQRFAEFRLQPNVDATQPTEILRIVISQNGKVLVAKKLSIKRVHPEVQTIWEGTDDFINVCINGSHRIYSSGGRLYCGVGGVPSLTIKEM